MKKRNPFFYSDPKRLRLQLGYHCIRHWNFQEKSILENRVITKFGHPNLITRPNEGSAPIGALWISTTSTSDLWISMLWFFKLGFRSYLQKYRFWWILQEATGRKPALTMCFASGSAILWACYPNVKYLVEVLRNCSADSDEIWHEVSRTSGSPALCAGFHLCLWILEPCTKHGLVSVWWQCTGQCSNLCGRNGPEMLSWILFPWDNG